MERGYLYVHNEVLIKKQVGVVFQASGLLSFCMLLQTSCGENGVLRCPSAVVLVMRPLGLVDLGRGAVLLRSFSRGGGVVDQNLNSNASKWAGRSCATWLSLARVYMADALRNAG